MPRKPFPWIASAFAALACAVLWATGLSAAIAVTLFLVWVASLWLAAAEPPALAPTASAPRFDETQMSDLYEASEVPIVVVRQGRVVVANAAARSLFGAHIVAQDIRMALRNPEAIRLIDSGSSGGVTVSGIARKRDVWRVNCKALGAGTGVLEFIDKTAEADISRAHTDFVANASHELRTPLASIIGYVETLREEGDTLDPATADRFLSTIQREAGRLQSLIGDLMSLSRIEAEKHELPTDRIDVSAAAERAARDAAGPERAERLELKIDGPLIVEGDEQQLEQVVRNLVDNAFKYGSPDQAVTVTLSAATPGRVALSVADRGEGIEPEHLPLLTRRFYRTDPGRSRASGGTGLGLAIVKHIVERHRGKLDISSTLGSGTTVTVWLNRAADA
jgi:two-component system, OmpR family, phosphate regulon sensor histidine kinase PhoR